MKTARIVPAQHMDRAVHGKTRYAIVIPNHPRGLDRGYEGPLSRDDAYRVGKGYYRKGDYIASWGTFEEAHAAAINLGMGKEDIRESFILKPDYYNEEVSWT